MAVLTDSGDARAALIQHSDVLRQQQLGFGNDRQNAQDVQSVPHGISPETHMEQKKGALSLLSPLIQNVLHNSETVLLKNG